MEADKTGLTEVKICPRCKEEKQICEFQKSGYCCKGCKSIMDKDYRLRNKEKLAKLSSEKWRKNPELKIRNRFFKERQRFGMSVTEYVKDKSCEYCGMTNDEHLNKWDERLQVHHKDDKGRKAMRLKTEVNNEINNLEVVCRACHCILTNKNRDYSKTKNAWITRRLNSKNNEKGKNNTVAS